MRQLVFLLLVIYSNTVMAIVPTIDQQQLKNDITTMASYGATIGAYMAKISQAITAVDQVRQLRGLQQVEAAGKAICALCTPVEEYNLQNYINNINDDLCSQFSFAMENITGLARSVNSLTDIIQLFQTNPKEAGLALQRAAIQTQVATQNTMTQIQMLMAQQAQKQLAEQKLEKQTTEEVYGGFKQSGL